MQRKGIRQEGVLSVASNPSDTNPSECLPGEDISRKQLLQSWIPILKCRRADNNLPNAIILSCFRRSGRECIVGFEFDHRPHQHSHGLQRLLKNWELRQQRRIHAFASLVARVKIVEIGVGKLMRTSGLSQTTVYKILSGGLVRRYVLANFRQAVDSLLVV